ncbi:MAG TPA: nucleotidyltransferase family protein [Bryobacteraceae bacterium]|nr:nucleotidyltransferase family protein [Bryobacteraceae bacterium]
MTGTLDTALEALRSHEEELRRFGVSHAAVFGSVSRGEARIDSDIDVLVELDHDRPMGVFEYARLKLYINEILGGAADVVNRSTLKPLIRDSVLHDAIHAF